MESEIPVLDWLNLPEGAQTISLWDPLHDADLQNITSDLLDRTMRLEFDNSYIRKFYHLPDDLKFVLLLEGVQSARIDRWAIWPGKFYIPDNTSHEEQKKLVAEYQSKWRNESMSWSFFEAELSAKKIEAEVSHAILAKWNDRKCALKIELHINDDTYHEIGLRSEDLKVLRTDGVSFSLEQFIRLGESYWQAFADRRISSGTS